MSRNVVLILVAVVVLGGLFFALRPDSPASGPQERDLEVEVRDGAMEPEELSVGEGDEVNLRVTTDEEIEFHLHGYDIERQVEPGDTVEVSFEADVTGRFEIEDHFTHDELGVLVVEPG